MSCNKSICAIWQPQRNGKVWPCSSIARAHQDEPPSASGLSSSAQKDHRVVLKIVDIERGDIDGSKSSPKRPTPSCSKRWQHRQRLPIGASWSCGRWTRKICTTCSWRTWPASLKKSKTHLHAQIRKTTKKRCKLFLSVGFLLFYFCVPNRKSTVNWKPKSAPHQQWRKFYLCSLLE